MTLPRLTLRLLIQISAIAYCVFMIMSLKSLFFLFPAGIILVLMHTAVGTANVFARHGMEIDKI